MKKKIKTSENSYELIFSSSNQSYSEQQENSESHIEEQLQ